VRPDRGDARMDMHDSRRSIARQDPRERPCAA
jgi:hypothetical protein